MWKGDTFAVVEQSAADTDAKLFSLHTIAHTAARGDHGGGPCGELKLISISSFGLQPIELTLAQGEKVRHVPFSYSELWVVEACGTTQKWSVLDLQTGYVVHLGKWRLTPPSSGQSPASR
jgi:hypothetical protein